MRNCLILGSGRSGTSMLADLRIGRRDAARVWISWCRNIMEELEPHFGNFFDFHYEQIVGSTVLGRLSDVQQAPLTGDFADPRLQRSRGGGRGFREAADIYRRLCRLVGHDRPGPGCQPGTRWRESFSG